jgi:hypothetical protein
MSSDNQELTFIVEPQEMEEKESGGSDHNGKGESMQTL